MIENETNTDRLELYIQIMFEYCDNYAGRDDILRMMISSIIKKRQLNYKERLKNIALNKIGNTINRGKWFAWRGASEDEKKDVEAVRDTIDIWMREDMLSVFFERLEINEQRKNFWMGYVKSMGSIHIFCNEYHRKILLGDPRLKNNVNSELIKNSQMKGSAPPVLVMQIASWVLVEVAAGGNAFYVYKRDNIEKYGLFKLSKVLQGQNTQPLTVDEFKKTNLERLDYLSQEGRFFHTKDWEYRLCNWLKNNGILRY